MCPDVGVGGLQAPYRLPTPGDKFQSPDNQIVLAANGPGMVQPHENYFKDEFVRQKLLK